MVNIPIFIIVSLVTKPASEETLRKFFPDYILSLIHILWNTGPKLLPIEVSVLKGEPSMDAAPITLIVPVLSISISLPVSAAIIFP